MTNKVIIHQDTDPENPRDWYGNVATFVCGHGRYKLGDVQIQASNEEAAQFPDNCLARTNLYLYDHSGLALGHGQTNPFSCRWDSGQVGIAYVTPEAMSRLGWARDAITTENALKAMHAEIEMYGAYLAGEVYGYEVVDSNGNELDSCWGFYGLDHVESGLAENVAQWADDPDYNGTNLRNANCDEEIELG